MPNQLFHVLFLYFDTFCGNTDKVAGTFVTSQHPAIKRKLHNPSENEYQGFVDIQVMSICMSLYIKKPLKRFATKVILSFRIVTKNGRSSATEAQLMPFPLYNIKNKEVSYLLYHYLYKSSNTILRRFLKLYLLHFFIYISIRVVQGYIKFICFSCTDLSLSVRLAFLCWTYQSRVLINFYKIFYTGMFWPKQERY